MRTEARTAILRFSLNVLRASLIVLGRRVHRAEAYIATWGFRLGGHVAASHRHVSNTESPQLFGALHGSSHVIIVWR